MMNFDLKMDTSKTKLWEFFEFSVERLDQLAILILPKRKEVIKAAKGGEIPSQELLAEVIKKAIIHCNTMGEFLYMCNVVLTSFTKNDYTANPDQDAKEIFRGTLGDLLEKIK